MPADPGPIRVLHGIPAHHRIAAAALYWRHFGPQILPFPAAQRQGVALIHRAMRPDHALAAISPQGRLIGIAGYRDARGGFLCPEPRGFQNVWGAWRGRWQHLTTRLYRTGPLTSDLVLDGVAVRPEWRGRGIARLLVEGVAQQARMAGHPALRAEVAADNGAALAAWRAIGFAPLPRREKLGWPWAAPCHVLRLEL